MKHLSEITHPELVAALVKPGQDIIDTLTPHKAHVWHMASCIPSEGGELFDAVKKFVIYNQELDLNNVVEELGDLEFYMEGIRAHFNISREETLQANIAKLSKRYVGLTYSDRSARERADKKNDDTFPLRLICAHQSIPQGTVFNITESDWNGATDKIQVLWGTSIYDIPRSNFESINQ